MSQLTKNQLERVNSVLLVVLVLFSSLFFSSASAAKYTEDEVKAVYLFNFTSFISWPKDSFNNTQEAFTYCSLGGENSVTKVLQEILLGEKVAGRIVLLKNITKLSDISNCQVLYLDKRKNQDIALILQTLKNSPTLTVSDAKGFAMQGGAVELSTKNEHIKLLINVAKVKATQLSISSKLLRIADLINAQNDDGDEPW